MTFYVLALFKSILENWLNIAKSSFIKRENRAKESLGF
jgi:hypothetical protein